MALALFTNNASTTLAAGISSSATSASLTSGAGALFPNPTAPQFFRATFIKNGNPAIFECVQVTARTTDTVTIVRAQEDTTALAWNAGDTFALLWTTADANSFTQQDDVQSGKYNYALDTGTANAYVVGLTPALSAHVVGAPIVWKALHSNTGASTFNDGVGSGPLITNALSALPGGTIVAGGIYTCTWDGANFQLEALSLVSFPQTAQEIAASITPANTSYSTAFGHDVRRYGAAMTGMVNDYSAFSQLAAVIGAGGNGYVPPLPFLLTENVPIVAPAYKRARLFMAGSTMYTTGAIYGFTVTGGFMGGLTIASPYHNNNADGGVGGSSPPLSLGAINISGAQNCVIEDPWSQISNTQASSGTYATVTLQPTDPTNDNTGAFWNQIIRPGMRQLTGNSEFYAPFCVLIIGACNSTTIEGGNIVSANYAVGIVNQTSTGATGGLANDVVLDRVTHEGGISTVLVNGNSYTGGSDGAPHIEGLRAINGRGESLSGSFLQLQGLGAVSAVPPRLRNNYFVSSVAGYVGQDNIGGLKIQVNCDDPSITPSFAPTVNFTTLLPSGSTSGALTAPWEGLSTQYQVDFDNSTSDSISCDFTNGSAIVDFNGATTSVLIGTVAIVFTGPTCSQYNSGPQTFQSSEGDAVELIAGGAFGLSVFLGTTQNAAVRNRIGGGGFLNFANFGDLEGIDGLSHTPGVRRRNFTGTVTFTGATTKVVTFANPEPNAAYMVVFQGNTATGVIEPSAQSTAGFTANAANASTQTIPYMLIGL